MAEVAVGGRRRVETVVRRPTGHSQKSHERLISERLLGESTGDRGQEGRHIKHSLVVNDSLSHKQLLYLTSAACVLLVEVEPVGRGGDVEQRVVQGAHLHVQEVPHEAAASGGRVPPTQHHRLEALQGIAIKRGSRGGGGART